MGDEICFQAEYSAITKAVRTARERQLLLQDSIRNEKRIWSEAERMDYMNSVIEYSVRQQRIVGPLQN